jgi:carbamate kinase
VPSPLPKRIFEIRPIKWLLERGTIVTCAGGGGIPTMYKPGADRTLIGVEAVIDKDLCSELLARELDADLLILATDAAAVFVGFGTPEAKAIHKASPAAISKHSFPAGSMGPKVDAACRFAMATGHTAAIGALADLPAIVRGEKGTLVSKKFEAMTWHA